MTLASCVSNLLMADEPRQQAFSITLRACARHGRKTKDGGYENSGTRVSPDTAVNINVSRAQKSLSKASAASLSKSLPRSASRFSDMISVRMERIRLPAS